MFLIIVVFLLVMFYGEPDLYDSLMKGSECNTSVNQEILKQQQLQLKLLNEQLIEFRESKEPTRKEYTDGY